MSTKLLKPALAVSLLIALVTTDFIYFGLSTLQLNGENEIIPLCDCHNTCRGPQLVYFCGTEARDKWTNPCLDPLFSDAPFCDESLDINSRVADLISRIPIEEKLGSAGTSTPLSNYATEMPSVGISYSQWWSEALHGIGLSPGVRFGPGEAASATSFPQIISTSHSYNRTLFASIGRAISTELRAFSNIGHAGLTVWTPNLNIFRDPRWGRGQETSGEDPYLTSEYVQAYVPALQYDNTEYGVAGGQQRQHLKVSACCKHFVAYSFENYEDMDRHHFNANVTAQDMADTYIPAFETCASPDKAAASCIMCSYNEVNGVPSCANKALLTDLARDQWHFDGYIVSDCGAVEDVYDTHYYAKTPQQAVKEVLEAGMDNECGKWFDEHLRATYQSGKIDEATIDTALSNLMKIHMRLGRFDKSGTGFDTITTDQVNSFAHQQLAVEASRQSVVLLKNLNGDSLPLRLDGIVKSLAVLGPNADAATTMLGNYHGIPASIVTPLDAFRALLNDNNDTTTTTTYKNTEDLDRVQYVKGCDIESDSTEEFAAATTAVQTSDAVVLVMGIDQSQEKEGHDRTHINLPGNQADFIESMVQAAADKPVVLVIVGGGSVCLRKYANDDRIGAILFIGYPGQAGGVGVAEAVFGLLNPSGRLTQTFYAEDYVNEVSFYDYNMRPTFGDNDTVFSPGRTYRFYRGNSVVYPFGHGLSYTSFEYAWVDDANGSTAPRVGQPMLFDVSAMMEGTTTLPLSISVTNSGSSHAGSEVVMVYLIPPKSSGVSAPQKVLRYFDKVGELAPSGGAALVSWSFSAADFSLAAEDGTVSVQTGEWTVSVGGLEKTIVVQ